MEVGVPHVAIVDEEVLTRSSLTGVLGLRDKALDGHKGRLDMEREEVLGKSAAEEVEEPLLLRRCRDLELDIAVVDKGKGNPVPHGCNIL